MLRQARVRTAEFAIAQSTAAARAHQPMAATRSPSATRAWRNDSHESPAASRSREVDGDTSTVSTVIATPTAPAITTIAHHAAQTRGDSWT